MKNKLFGQELEKRTKKFAVNLIKFSSTISNTIELRIIKNQLIKSGTSIGANYREANKSRSKADFLNKIKICQGEANETIYWLEVLIEICRHCKTPLWDLRYECAELLAIFTSIANKLKD